MLPVVPSEPEQWRLRSHRNFASGGEGDAQLQDEVKACSPVERELIVAELQKAGVKVGSLFWHDGAIPQGEIWLKLGGDKGGGTFKMCFQIVNTQAPNSPTNTCVFSIFEAEDSVTNLKVVADRYGQEISNIESHTWK